ncbi:hypothetical protein L1D44_13055 [Shewanella sp. Isolate13]|nr:hypothetical protein [Shewanella sp. Isolate13]MCG9730763.1 hypothetical protein [Shewanella sp. Isolate13]
MNRRYGFFYIGYYQKSEAIFLSDTPLGFYTSEFQITSLNIFAITKK